MSVPHTESSMRVRVTTKEMRRRGEREDAGEKEEESGGGRIGDGDLPIPVLGREAKIRTNNSRTAGATYSDPQNKIKGEEEDHKLSHQGP